ncbi:MAG: L-seryl-tRNA(Sec) selenium transferase [Planctomycetota bacterium]|jgi:L-seryl-tRNA(Ser) seleniumtransferase
MKSVDKNQLLRRLPAVDRVLGTPAIAALKERILSDLVDAAVRREVDETRASILNGGEPRDIEPDAIAERAEAALSAQLAPGVQRCINATGVVLHTGLGRAVLPPAAMEAIERELGGYAVVSIDREEGARLRRETAIAKILAALTGAEAATVVNNNAAATLIALNTMAAGQEAILSRGQLVEIGGSFRMPDVFEAAGVALREVGTTNRTHLPDYAHAIGEFTGLILRVHPSNYKVTGFTCEPTVEELVALAHEHGLPMLDDLGAGALVALPPEPTLMASIEAGADLITCSGDKLIGGPQSGILLGKKEWVDRVRRNPLFRTLRVDKLTLTALEATLRLFLRPEGPGDDHPSLRMLRIPGEELVRRAGALADRVRAEAPHLNVTTRPGHSQVGSGSLPGESLPTTLVCMVHPSLSASAFARRLRLGSTPVYTRVVDDAVCADPRTLLDGEESELVRILKEIP